MNTSPLPELPMWQARSFWITIVASAAQISALAGFDLFGSAGVENESGLVDNVMQIVAVVGLVWAWFERKAPNFQLTV